MGRRGYVQKRQAEHDTSVALSDWAQGSAVWFLEKRGLNVYTGDSSGMDSPESSDHWEIEIPYRTDKSSGGSVRDFERINRIVAELRRRPGLVKGDGGDGKYGDALADLLEAGMIAAQKHGYDWIMVDFW